MKTSKVKSFKAGGVKFQIGQKVVINLYNQRSFSKRLSKVNENSFVYIASKAEGYGSKGTVYISLNEDLTDAKQVDVVNIDTEIDAYNVYVAVCCGEVLETKLIRNDSEKSFFKNVCKEHEIELDDLETMTLSLYESSLVKSNEEVMPAVVETTETVETPAQTHAQTPAVAKTYKEIANVIEKYIVSVAKSNNECADLLTEKYLASIGSEVVRVLGKARHLINIIDNYTEYLPTKFLPYFDMNKCYEACLAELKGVVTPPTPPMPSDFAEEIISELYSASKEESSEDFFAEGINAIMQKPSENITWGINIHTANKPTKSVANETKALRLLHFFNANATQYDCLAIDTVRIEKQFIDAYCRTKSIAFLSGLDHYVSVSMINAMMEFEKTEFYKPIYFSERKEVFETDDLVIDKYGFAFRISIIEKGLYLVPIQEVYEIVYRPYKAEDLRLCNQYEKDCFFIETKLQLEINPITGLHYCIGFEPYMFESLYSDFFVYKLQSLSGENKDYIIRQIAKLDMGIAQYICQKVMFKTEGNKQLFTDLRLKF